MFLGDVRQVRLLEGDLLAAGERAATHQLVDFEYEFVDCAGLLDQGVRDEGRALREEVEDVQAGGAEQGFVEVSAVGREMAFGIAAHTPQVAGEGLVAETDGVEIADGQFAQGPGGFRRVRR
ncbi:hypothetical protein OG856_05045 [Streptomyces sp. NBC_01594]